MNDPVRDAVNAEHLRLLRLAYLFTAAWNSLYAAMAIAYAAAAWQLTSKTMIGVWGQYFSEAEAAVLRWMFVGGTTALAMALCGLIILKLFTAHALKHRRRRALCIITGALSCLHLPYGTALGVATLMVLSRDSVVALFEQARAAGQPDHSASRAISASTSS